MNVFPSVIESIGRFLPSRTVTTREVLDGCRNPIKVPLERLTGIRSRHFAGDTEFALELAAKAIEDCLKHSRLRADQYDLLISANISRYDGPGTIGYEPSSAVTLKRLLGFKNAIAFDISNACATMWTATYVADALIQSGAVRSAMIVSGEFITHLTRNAQLEIENYLDPQLASLTLGDAGMAVSLVPATREDEGFREFEMYTLGRYSRLCVAQPSNKPHGGAVMHTDAVKVTAAIVPHAAAHAVHVLNNAGHHVNDVQHIIPHQTSRLTIQGALDEIARRFDTDCREQMIDNLENRGNTASTTHFLALRDCIDSGRIQSGDKIVFAISGSGQTTGTAIYHCDDLPQRIRSYTPDHNGSLNSVHNLTGAQKQSDAALSVPFVVRSVASIRATDGRGETLPMLKAAATRSIEDSGIERSEIELILSTGVYRTDFLTEPALAAILAGDLDINADQPAEHPVKTFGFDLLNGSIGFLNACHLVSEMGRAGKCQTALVVASEVENNDMGRGDPLLGIRPMATAAILSESDDGVSGFQAFRFDHLPQLQDEYLVRCKWREGTGEAYLIPEIDPQWRTHCLPHIVESVRALLAEQGLTMDDIRWWLPPQGVGSFSHQLADAIGVDEERWVIADDGELDVFTSSTPIAIDHVQRGGLVSPGDLGLIINIGSGVQIATALYRF